ncbi:MAG TPA: aminoacetone oxidase family FAD-binding enzyme, partial [Candidatus Moranbacteria bacterium]|nr:aminoacetone oxidase family FAD-binding enzyme [Candidatus Moranbacteria bacterium]
AQNGARVVLIDRNDNLGRKLLLTGNSRCNITQAEFDTKKLAEKYGKKGRFLLSSLSAFGADEVVKFFEKNNLKLKTEKSGKIFPQSDKAGDVLETLRRCLFENGVTTFFESEVADMELEGNKITKIKLKKGEVIAKNYILSAGGKSYPQTGSTGRGFDLAKKMGHHIISPKPALTPIKIKADWLKEAQGISLRGVEISAYQKNKKIFSEIGDLIFTHFGISGPAVLNISRRIGDLLEKDAVKIKIDIKPELSFEKLDEVLQNDFENNASKKIGNCMQDFYSPKLLQLILQIANSDNKKNAANISREERRMIVKVSKGLEMEVEELLGFERAMVTNGGVDLKQVDSKTMQSKIVENLFFAGEVLDIDGPTGGYNLQICWSTGYVAGKWAAVKRLS